MAPLSRRCPRSSQNQPSACPKRSARPARGDRPPSAARRRCCPAPRSAAASRSAGQRPAVAGRPSRPATGSTRRAPAAPGPLPPPRPGAPAVGPDRLQHPVPGFTVVVNGQERLLDQAEERGQDGLRGQQRASAGSAASWHTCSAAASVAPPGKMASRLASTCSGSDSSSQLQSTTARSVWCRGTAVRLPPVSSSNLASSRSASWAADSVRSRAAASSIASGMPSSARQIRATSAALAASTVKSRPNGCRPVGQQPDRGVARDLASSVLASLACAGAAGGRRESCGAGSAWPRAPGVPAAARPATALPR